MDRKNRPLEHIIQVCPLYEEKRREFLTQDTTLHTKLWGLVLRRPAKDGHFLRLRWTDDLTRPCGLIAEEEEEKQEEEAAADSGLCY